VLRGRRGAVALGVEPQDPHEASIGLAQAFDALDCGRLSGPVWADDAEDLTPIDREGHILDRDVPPVPLV
jgi:hypothetical protein